MARRSWTLLAINWCLTLAEASLLRHQAPLPLVSHLKSDVRYISAEVVYWDYAPNGDQCSDTPSGRPLRGPSNSGRRWPKALYREYTDASFKVLRQIGAAGSCVAL
jgi:hypothetical protein